MRVRKIIMQKEINPNSTIGILGSGQLGRMFVKEATTNLRNKRMILVKIRLFFSFVVCDD